MLIKDLIVFHNLDVLAISKTWLHETDDSADFIIADYTLVRRNRSTGARDGGVALYINSSLSFSIVNSDIPLADTCVDMVGVIIYLRRKRVTVFSIYRPPRSPFSEFQIIESYLANVASAADIILCMGDFNVNMLDRRNSATRYVHDIISFLAQVDRRYSHACNKRYCLTHRLNSGFI